MSSTEELAVFTLFTVFADIFFLGKSVGVRFKLICSSQCLCQTYCVLNWEWLSLVVKMCLFIASKQNHDYDYIVVVVMKNKQ